MAHPLDPLLKPGSIALVGASERDGSSGKVLADLVINSAFTGRVLPVNRNYRSILGKPCYPDIKSLPETVEHVVLAITNDQLEQALVEAIEHGAKAATIYSSCVLGNDTSPSLRQRLQTIAKDAGIAICGGNGMGFYNITAQLYAGIFPLPGTMTPGSISYIAQSGSAFSALAHNGVRLKFNLCVSSGNEITTTVADYMGWALAQPQTRVIALFLETVRDPDGFLSAVELAQKKDIPVVMLKVGKSPLASQMAVTHTGAIAGNHAVFEALVRKFGMIEVNDFAEIIAVLQMFQSPRRAGPGALATIQESGGLMELATDIAYSLNVPFASIEKHTRSEIQKHLEPGLKADNPLDAWGSNHDFKNRFYHCLSALMKDPNVAAGMFISNFRDDYYLSEALYKVVEKVIQETTKPLSIINCHGDLKHENLCHRSRDAGIPFIDGVHEGMLAIRHLFSYRDFCNKSVGRQPTTVPNSDIADQWKKRLSTAQQTLSEYEAMALLKDFSIDIPHIEQVTNEAELTDAASRIGYPLVLKTAQSGINHKSDQGGVVINIADQQTLLNEYRKLSASISPQALVCQMISPGSEIGLGMINDPQFGPVIMVSSGGLLIEILKDRAVALAPVDHSEAEELLLALRADTLLRGVRGQAPGNRNALIDTIVAFSQLCYQLRDYISEIDINPVIVNQNHAIAVDALIVSRQSQ